MAETSRLHVVVLPRKYELCKIEHIVALMSDMIIEVVEMNDRLQSKNTRVTRFQSS